MWIEVEAILENTRLKEMDIPCEATARMMINTDDLEAYREILDEDSNIVDDEMMIYLKQNGSFAIKYNYSSFKTLINAC
jgi:hypothetical protein